MLSALYVILPDSVFIPCNHGLDFDIISLLCENSINQYALLTFRNDGQTTRCIYAIFESSPCFVSSLKSSQLRLSEAVAIALNQEPSRIGITGRLHF